MKKSDWNQLRLNLITASCGNNIEAMEIAYYHVGNSMVTSLIQQNWYYGNLNYIPRKK